jgi:hypothetical protein
MAETVKYRLEYQGGEADSNRLPAHQGAQSLEGITWSVALIANYLATGKIRTRGQLSDKIQVFIYPARPGSFVSDLILFITEPNNLYITSIFGGYVVATAGQMLNAAIVRTIKEVCGVAHALTKLDGQMLSKLPSGDLEALVDRIEPSMRRAHEVIENGASTLSIKDGTQEIIRLNSETKSYVNANIVSDETVEKRVSVGAFNANTGNGRFFLPEIGKTVPFSVDRDAGRKTREALTRSLDLYVRDVPSYITIRCVEVLSVDERIKKLIVKSAKIEK